MRIFIPVYFFLLLITSCHRPKQEPDVGQIIEKTLTSVEEAATALGKIPLFVNYDEAGNIWLTGRAARERGKMMTEQELAIALSAIDEKGVAVIGYVYDASKGGLLGPAPARDLNLEARIRERLIDAGFTCAGDDQQPAEQ